jgi:hypothetical protein
MKWINFSLAVALMAAVAMAQAAPAFTGMQEQVANVERAFAATMKARDYAAFVNFLSEEAIFETGAKAQRGKKAIATAGSRSLPSPDAPFSWEPDQVEVLASGTLAKTSGPVYTPDGKLIARFNSVWRLEAPNTWRIVFDGGSDVCDCNKNSAYAGSACSTISCTLVTPLYSLASSRKATRAFAQGVGVAEPDGVVAGAVPFPAAASGALLQDALADDAEFVAEHGRREALAPDLAVHQFDELRSCSRRLPAGRPSRSRAPAAAASATRGRRLRRPANASKASARIVRPAAIAWPPNLSIRLGARFDTRSSASRRWKPGIERPEPLIQPSAPGANVIVGRKNFSFRREATMPITPWCQPSSNTLMVLLLAGSKASRCSRAVSCISASISRRFRLMSLSCCAMRPGAALVVGDQAFDPERHVVQPAGRVQARAEREAEVERRGAARLAAGHAEQGGHAGMHAAGAHALHALRDQDAVVGDRAARRRPRCPAPPGRAGCPAWAESARRTRRAAQFRAQGQQHVEHHADAGQVLAREAAFGLVRIDDDARGRQRVGRQVVVGDDDFDAAPVRLGHAVDAGDAVVDGDDDVGRFSRAVSSTISGVRP